MHDNEAKGREVIAELVVAASLPAKLSCRTLEETELEACRSLQEWRQRALCFGPGACQCPVSLCNSSQERVQWSRQALNPPRSVLGIMGIFNCVTV